MEGSVGVLVGSGVGGISVGVVVNKGVEERSGVFVGLICVVTFSTFCSTIGGEVETTNSGSGIETQLKSRRKRVTAFT